MPESRVLNRREEHKRVTRAALEEAALALFTDPQEELEQIRLRMRLMVDQPSLVATYLTTIQELRHEVAVFVAERRGVPPEHPYALLVSAAASAAWDVALHAWSAGHSGTLADLRRAAFEQLAKGISPIVT